MPAAHPIEVELKLAVAEGEMPLVRRRLARLGRARIERLESVYYDTADGLLASHGYALRLRRVGGTWVQTVKRGMPAAALSARGEWDAPARMRGGRPCVDRARLAATPLGALLAQHPRAVLREVFRTRFERSAWTVEREGARVEIALDSGQIVAGARREPIREIEIELQSGAASALPALALQLAGGGNERALALLPLPESKAARGLRLAAGAGRAPVKAGAARLCGGLDPRIGAGAALRALALRAADVFAANAHGILASDDPEFVHQARVALRRLRSAVRLLRRSAPFSPALSAELRWIARTLGAQRDLDVLALETVPLLARDSGASSRDLDRLRKRIERLRSRARAQARAALASPRCARLVLRLHKWALRPVAEDEPLAQIAPALLDRLLERLLDDARGFARHSPERQHRVRIRAKRLRYALDLAACTLPAKAVERYTRRLASVQDALGQLNDAAVASEQLLRLARTGALRATIRAWADNRRKPLVAAAARAAARLAAAQPPWRGSPTQQARDEGGKTRAA